MLVRLLRATRHIDALARGAAVVREEGALRWLSAAQRAEFSCALYGHHARYRPGSAHAHRGLFSFEQQAITTYFPSPPAKILIGGAGTGREALALANLGFDVSNFYEPCGALLAQCDHNLTTVGVKAHGWLARHEELSFPLQGSPFDGYVLGWGSYTHVLGRNARARVLSALRRSSPAAPVLLSFLCAGVTPDPVQSRAARLQTQVRALLERLPGRTVPEPGDAYRPEAGFVHLFTRDEIELEATIAGYTVAHYAERETYPHAVLIP